MQCNIVRGRGRRVFGCSHCSACAKSIPSCTPYPARLSATAVLLVRFYAVVRGIRRREARRGYPDDLVLCAATSCENRRRVNPTLKIARAKTCGKFPVPGNFFRKFLPCASPRCSPTPFLAKPGANAPMCELPERNGGTSLTDCGLNSDLPNPFIRARCPPVLFGQQVVTSNLHVRKFKTSCPKIVRRALCALPGAI